jgi:phage minor structural protein
MADKHLYILGFDKSTVGILSNRMPFSLPFYDDLQERSLDDFTDILTLKVPANHKDAVNVDADNYILYPEANGKQKLYKIMEVTEYHEGGESYKEVYAEVSAQDDLIRDVVRPMSFTSATLSEVLTAILNGSEWAVGFVEDFGILDYEIKEYPTKLQAIIDAFKAYGAELDFEYLTQGTTIIGQQVNGFKMIGQETGKPFMIGKDIKGVERKEDRSKLVTAMIGVGKDINGVPLSFSAETETQLGRQIGGFPEGYEKAVGNDWLGNKEALQAYSRNGKHIIGVYKDTEAQSSYELFRNTLEALKKYSQPIMTYKATVALLAKIVGYAHDEVALGDTVMVQDKTLVPELYVKARIRKISRSITNPQDDAVELGDYVPVAPPTNRIVELIQSKIRNNEETWNKAQQIDELAEKVNNVPTMEDFHSVQSQRLKVRYVRNYSNGNSVNTGNHLVELKVMKAGANIAKGILPTSSNPDATNLARVTDDIVDYVQYATLGSGLQYVEIDLGSVVENVEYIHVWNYYSDDRSYNQHMVDVSEDGQNWVRLYNSDKNGTHTESADGFIVAVNSSAILSTQKEREDYLEESQKNIEESQAQIVTDVEDLKGFKESTEYDLTQKVDLVTYNQKVQTMEQNIADKADLEYVNGELVDKADKASTYTKTEVDNSLKGYVSVTEYSTDEEARVQELTNLETRVSQTEEDITLTASKQELNDLTIGGGNLLNGSAFKTLPKVWGVDTKLTLIEEGYPNAVTATNSATASQNTGVIVGNNANLTAGKEYTLSFEAKTDGTIANFSYNYIMSGLQGNSNIGVVNVDKTKIDTWVRYTLKVIPTKDYTDAGIMIAVFNLEAGKSFGIRKVQLEEGSKATTWGMSTEETDVRLSDAEASIKVNAEQISLRVTKDVAEDIAEDTNRIPFRFIRYIGQGNSVDAVTKLAEMTVNLRNGSNVALGKTVTSGEPNAVNLSSLTDGALTTLADIGSGSVETQWFMIDLGQVYKDVYYINLWHDYSNTARKYFFNLQISEDGINWISIYDTAHDGEYAVSSAGFAFFVNQQVALRNFATEIRQTAEAISLKAEASTVDSLGERLTTAEELITPEAIITTVMAEESAVVQAIGNKADASALDDKADATAFDDFKKDVTANYVTTTALTQNNESFEFKFTKTGGVNLVKNSVGYAGLDFWSDAYGTLDKISTINNDALDALGFGSGFYFAPDGVNKGMYQDVYVEAGVPVTLSWYLNKLSSGAITGYSYRFWVQIQEYNGTELIKTTNLDDNSSLLTSGYEFNSITYTPTRNMIRIRFIAYDKVEAMVSGIMLNTGDVALQWTQAVGEVYNSNVTVDAKGIKVKATDYNGYTAITPEEFAGYYEVEGKQEKVFTLNKDTTVIAKAEVQKEIRMSPIKIVPIASGTLNGWAFVADDE